MSDEGTPIEVGLESGGATTPSDHKDEVSDADIPRRNTAPTLAKGTEDIADDENPDRRSVLSEPNLRRTVTFSSKVIEHAVDRESHLTLPSSQMRQGSFMHRGSAWPKSLSERPRTSHLEVLLEERAKSMGKLSTVDDVEAAEGGVKVQGNKPIQSKQSMEMKSEFVQKLEAALSKDNVESTMPPMEIRLQNVSYQVPTHDDPKDGNKIATVYNTSALYKIRKFTEWILEAEDPHAFLQKKHASVTNVLSNVNLVLQPQKMYLVLGPPLSGKTSLLKAIAGMLPQGEFPKAQWTEISKTFHKGHKDGKTAEETPENKFFTGQVLYNNLVCSGEGADESRQNLFRNLVAFVRQNDAHAPRFTVGETFTFAGNCKHPGVKTMNRELDDEGRVGLTLRGLGLNHVKDTFVGNDVIRGVSGGQRRRATLGEMLTFDTPLLCGDEISTGLDTASTVDILRILSYLGRLLNRVSVVSLLQPSPEAVSLFDEIILLGAGGHVIFAGPTGDAVDYFKGLGYVQPDAMDDADYLLAVASSDRKHLFQRGAAKVEEGEVPTEEVAKEPHTPTSFSEVFAQSKDGVKIAECQQKEWKYDWSGGKIEAPPGAKFDVKSFENKYQNSFLGSVWLNLKRSFILWLRDMTYIRASAIKNIAMGLSVGAVFFATDVNSSFFGVLFQGNLFIMLGAMTSAPENLSDRAIFYKHNDSNFYPAISYVIGQALALVPQMVLDVILFGTIVYWMVGFTATAQGFILYLVLFFSFNFTMGQTFGLLASIAPNKTVVQSGGAIILMFNVLFCGYIISPDVIPDYYIWIYWMSPLSWIYRALLLNEYTSDDYPNGSGDVVLESFGFMYKGEPFGREWIGYCYAYLVPYLILCMVSSACFLRYFRMEPTPKGLPDISEDIAESDESANESLANDAFTPVNLSFTDLSYEVKSSTGSDNLRLLNNVSGVFSGGRMCALMGESGAGKTTLMDVIALRKEGGEISGDILLNGFPQEEISFRRCSGYVEQFDVQSAELTVRETMRFSAQLRIDKSNSIYQTEDGLDNHIDFILKTLELKNEADLLVGTDGEGGLTFEQRKRVSIAVELAASPSIVFLDEPTSGLDARAALLVMKGLRKMCDTGRTIVATIHQPSSAVFDMFDDLLFLKKGGEVVFFGDLGSCSSHLISYFENIGCRPINSGENPSTWMLNVINEKITVKGENGGDLDVHLDFASEYKKSSNYKKLQQRLIDLSENRDEKLHIKYENQFAASRRDRDTLMAHRLVTIYWRSPAYNLSRMVLALVIAFILSSSFIPIRTKTLFSETEMTSMLSTIFLSFIIIGVLSITSVLPVMNNVRDMYYRHKAAGMLDGRAVGRALATAEWRFIVISGVLFCIMFIPISGIANQNSKATNEIVKGVFAFWGFFTFNIAIYSYAGQLFMCLVRGSGTAMVLASVFLGMNNFFSGLIVRPQQMTGIWVFTYWITHGHFVYEGLSMSIFSNDDREVVVHGGSDYWDDLECDINAVDGNCVVTVHDYVNAFFGGKYSEDNIGRNLIILGFILVVLRASTFLALKYLIFSSK